MLVVIYGFLIGAFVSLIGGGGASLYLGVLTSQLHIPAPIAAPTSLFIALPALFFGFLTQLKVKNVEFKIGNKMILSAIPGIVIGTISAKYIPLNVYNWIVGLILMVMGIIVLIKFFRHTESDNNKKDSNWLAISLGLLSGLMVGIGGLSGGATTVGGLTIMGLGAVEAAGTTTYVLWVMSLIGFISHLFTSQFAWTAGLGLMVGAIVGSVITPLVLKKMNYVKINTFLTPLLGVIIFYFGIKMIL
jgi:uncharacterized membrane protein YfcA